MDDGAQATAPPESASTHRALDPASDPATYRHGPVIQPYTDIEDIYCRVDTAAGTEEELPALRAFAQFVLKLAPTNEKELTQAMIKARRQFKASPKRSALLHVLPSLSSLSTVAALGGGGDGGEDEEETSAADTLTTLRRLLVKKAAKSQSGVLVITVLTSPYPTVNGKTQKFSCEWNCYYCPNEPDQPRSYLHDEPSVLRANQNGFDAVLQFTDRASTLAMNGHPVDKVELLVLGGTWASYPHSYQEEFVRDLFYAANTFAARGEGRRLERYSLDREMVLNEAAACKIIGLTLETRPDTIDTAELRRLRRYGCTRVQLGVQHTDDAILAKINRGHETCHTADAIAFLKDACFKVDIHLMPNLPGASPAADLAMFERVLHDPALQADQWKIYPCEVTPWTVIKKWYDRGEYVPYDESTLAELLATIKRQVHPWIRLNRVVRDIPSQYVLGGVDAPNLRQTILASMKAKGHRCRCIRCREVGDDTVAAAAARLVVRKYLGSNGVELFLSFEATDKETLLGFARLRFPPHPTALSYLRAFVRAPLTTMRMALTPRPKPGARGQGSASQGDASRTDGSNADRDAGAGAADDASAGVVTHRQPRRRRTSRGTATSDAAAAAAAAAHHAGSLGVPFNAGVLAFPELEGAALVRELHVYGQLVPTAHRQKTAHAQHAGFGRRLMREAEHRAAWHGHHTVAVIAGIGARNYYRKLGYEVEGDGGFMLKRLRWYHPWRLARTATICAALLSVLLLLGLLYRAILAYVHTHMHAYMHTCSGSSTE